MTLQLNAKIREQLKKKSDIVRSENQIPAVVYGHGVENVNLQVEYVPFTKVLEAAGESTLIDLVIDGKDARKVIISDVQTDPISGRPSHIDFLQVNMKEKINASVEINFIGESKLVKEDGAILVHNISEVEIRCLPSDLLHEIDVDVSALDSYEDTITIADLKVPASVEILHHEPTDIVVSATMPKVEKEEPVPAAEAAPAAPAADAAKK